MAGPAVCRQTLQVTAGYLPPCSGRNGHVRFADIKVARSAEGERLRVLAQTRFLLWRYWPPAGRRPALIHQGSMTGDALGVANIATKRLRCDDGVSARRFALPEAI